jgi:hypothetical protein
MIRTLPRYLLAGYLTVPVLRQQAGSWVGGRYEPAIAVEVLIKANVQPMPRAIATKLQPTGDITRQGYMVFTNDEIRQKREGDAGWEADTVMWNDEELEVMEVYRYQMGPLDHYEALCLRKEVS